MLLYKVLKRSRVLLSLLVFVGIAYYFVVVQLQVTAFLAPLLKTQLVPALLGSFAAGLWVLLALLALTLVFGRVYCSLLCPMGTLQDISIRTAHLFKTKKQRRFHYTKAHKMVRYVILTVVAVCWLAGMSLPLLLLDPYSNFGRMAVHVFGPAFLWLNNMLSSVLPEHVFYLSHSVESFWTYAIPFSVFLLIVGLSAFRGRLFCNTICPVGSFLGLISRFAMFRPVINRAACTHCQLCGMKCKSECIDNKKDYIDHSRCVACLNCTLACKQKAVTFAFSWKKHTATNAFGGALSSESIPTPQTVSTNEGLHKKNARRAFLAAAGGTIGALALYRASGKTPLFVEPPTTDVISPPGSKSLEHLKKFCTACQACVAACPSHIIKPSLKGYGLDGWMLPELDYTAGFCNYECTRCSEVCPTLAIDLVGLEQKKLIQIGKAQFTKRHCIVMKDRTDCGACDEHCPTKAVHMVPFGDQGLRIPKVDVAYCIGCGGCEYICPATPKAIVVHSSPVHGIALAPAVEEQKDLKVTDFGF